MIDNKKDKYIMFLHCICYDSSIFRNQVKEYSKFYNIILIDLPGHGMAIRNNEKILISNIIHDIIKVLNLFNIDKIDILSLSLGTIIATYLMLSYPNRVNKVVLEGCAFGLQFTCLKWLYTMFNKIKYILPRKLYLSIVIFLIIPRNCNKIYRKEMYQNAISMQKNVLYDWFEIMENFFYEYDKSIAKELLLCHIPKLYILGIYDFTCLPKIKKTLNNNEWNKLYILKGCGHLCHIDLKNDFTEITTHFFES